MCNQKNSFRIITIIAFLLLSNLGLALSSTISDSIVYLSFNGSATDESVYKHDITKNGAQLTNDKYNIPDQAFLFDGKDDYITIKQGSDLNTKTFSILLSFKAISFQSPYSYLMTKGSSAQWKDYKFLFLIHESGRIGFSIGNGTSYVSKYTEKQLLPNYWYNTALVMDENNVASLYVNGKLELEESLDITPKINSSDITIGISNVMSFPFNGIIDEIYIFNRPLSKQEIIEFNPPLNTISGKVVTNSEILGYTASVGGATIQAITHDLSAVTDVYGEFSINNIPPGDCVFQISSNYFQTLTKTVYINYGDTSLEAFQLYIPKCQNMYTQQQLNNEISNIMNEKDNIINEKNLLISELNDSIASMYTQGELDIAIQEAEKRGELKYDINNDGKVGFEEVIKYLEILSGVRLESLIIFPNDKKIILTE